jgi:hypothetical protein
MMMEDRVYEDLIEETREMMDEAYGTQEDGEEIPERKERWRVTDDESAEWLIEKVNEEMVEINRYEMSLANKIDILREKLEKVRREKEDKLAWRDSYLLEYFESVDESHKKRTKTLEKYRLPSGEIVKKYQNPEYRRDNEALLQWVKENNLNKYLEVKESAKWGDLKKMTKLVGNTLVYEETGEIVEGVTVVERPPVIEFKQE